MFIVDHIESEIWLNGHLFDNTWVWGDGSTWDYDNVRSEDHGEGYGCLKMNTSGLWFPVNCTEGQNMNLNLLLPHKHHFRFKKCFLLKLLKML